MTLTQSDMLAQYRAYFEREKSELVQLEAMQRAHKALTNEDSALLAFRVSSKRDLVAEIAEDIEALSGDDSADMSRWNVNPADEGQEAFFPF